MGIDVVMSGPLFDGGTSTKAVDAYLEEVRAEIAQEGVNRIKSELGRVLKHPTGHYKGSIQTDRSTQNNIITDGGVVYGPWLEGVSSRNRSTRFKGYSTFRRMTQQLNSEVQQIVEKELPKLVGRLNG